MRLVFISRLCNGDIMLREAGCFSEFADENIFVFRVQHCGSVAHDPFSPRYDVGAPHARSPINHCCPQLSCFSNYYYMHGVDYKGEYFHSDDA